MKIKKRTEKKPRVRKKRPREREEKRRECAA